MPSGCGRWEPLRGSHGGVYFAYGEKEAGPLGFPSEGSGAAKACLETMREGWKPNGRNMGLSVVRFTTAWPEGGAIAEI